MSTPERALVEFIRSMGKAFKTIANSPPSAHGLATQFAKDCAAQCDKVASTSDVALAGLDALRNVGAQS